MHILGLVAAKEIKLAVNACSQSPTHEGKQTNAGQEKAMKANPRETHCLPLWSTTSLCVTGGDAVLTPKLARPLTVHSNPKHTKYKHFQPYRLARPVHLLFKSVFLQAIHSNIGKKIPTQWSLIRLAPHC